jgi:diguanylate cyclase (GGDEF)-like protein
LGLSLPDIRPLVSETRSGAWADGWATRFERPVVRADGTPIWARVSLSAIWDTDGCLRHYVCQMEDISERKQAEAELVHRTLHDPLTGLANRELLTDHLEWTLARAARTHDSLAVLFVDLDGFKRVNDTFGHDSGDQVLKEAGRRIKGALRAVDTVGRFGGDEFVIVCEGPIEEADVRVVADRIERVLSQPFEVPDGIAQIGASVGAVLGKADDHPFDLLRDADWEMYRIKEAHHAARAGRVAISSAARQARFGARRARPGRRVS